MNTTFKQIAFLIPTIWLTGCVTAPPYEFPSWVELSDVEKERYSKALVATRRPTLPGRTYASHIYVIRLTSINSEIDPFVIRAACDISCDLRVVQLETDENFETVSVAKSYAIGVNSTPFNEIDGFRSDVQPYREFPPKRRPRRASNRDYEGDFVVNIDSSRWIIEIVDEFGYSISNGTGADEHAIEAFTNLCWILVYEAKLPISGKEFCSAESQK